MTHQWLIRAVTFLAVAAILPLIASDRSTYAEGDLLSPSQGCYLFVTECELLVEMVPMSLEILRDDHFFWTRAYWCGMPLPDVEGTSASFTVTVSVTPSREAAMRVARTALEFVATPPVEVSGTKPYEEFSDRAWHSGGRLLFMRKNVVCDIRAWIPDEKMRTKQLLAVASQLGNRIDLLAAGKPVQRPILPVFASELRRGYRQLWDAKGLEKVLWGEEGSHLLVMVDQWSIRKIPAKKISPQEYIVPFAYLAALLDVNARVTTVKSTSVTVWLNGRQITLDHGQKAFLKDGNPVTLEHPIEIRHGEALIPLTYLTQVLDYQIDRKQIDTLDVTVVQRIKDQAQTQEPAGDK